MESFHFLTDTRTHSGDQTPPSSRWKKKRWKDKMNPPWGMVNTCEGWTPQGSGLIFLRQCMQYEDTHHSLTHVEVCWRILTYAEVCWRFTSLSSLTHCAKMGKERHSLLGSLRNRNDETQFIREKEGPLWPPFDKIYHGLLVVKTSKGRPPQHI